MSDFDLDELRAELDEFSTPDKGNSTRTIREERIIAGFEDIDRFVEQQGRLFQRFEQADGARTAERDGGSGLGLPIVQQILLAHHGTARVETAPGAGCNFILELPPG